MDAIVCRDEDDRGILSKTENECRLVALPTTSPRRSLSDIIRRQPSTPEADFSLARGASIPSWSRTRASAFKTINARAETVTEQPASEMPS